MKFILNAIWLPLGLALIMILGIILPIIYRESLSSTTLFFFFLTTALIALYFSVLLYKALNSLLSPSKLRSILNKIDTSQQEIINDERRKKHRKSLIYKCEKSQHREINFFGSYLQCAVYAPDYKRAKTFYNSMPKAIKELGGEFYYSRNGYLTLVKE
jgi:hypothetical protein